MRFFHSLAGKIALVTGGSRGVGPAIVQRLADDGATVVFTHVACASAAREFAGYSIGAFAQRDVRANRPYGPVNAEAMKTFQPLQPADFAAIKVEPVGEP